MPRCPRFVIPNNPHHVMQRGNRNQQTFFSDRDYETYISTLREQCDLFGVEIWAYCLMANHVHLIAVPQTEDSLRLAIGQTHEKYTRMINFRNEWSGFLWQGRFKSKPMDEKYLLNAALYIEMNPVAAGICKTPTEYRWSSARAHVNGRDDWLVKVAPLLDRFGKWQDCLDHRLSADEYKLLDQNVLRGRLIGSDNPRKKFGLAFGR